MNVLTTYGEHSDKIQVYETDTLFGEKGRFRVLQFADEAVQGAIDCHHPERIVFEYPRALIHLMEYNASGLLDDIFIIGHGIGTLAGYFSDKHCVSVEINEQIAQISKQYFDYNGAAVRIGDGRDVLEKDTNVYQYMIIDAFTSDGIPKYLCTRTFFSIVRSHLKPNGAILCNAIGRGKQDIQTSAIYSTLQQVFPYVYAFTLPSESERDIRNSLLVGSNQAMQYRLRSMAGFIPYTPNAGYIIEDD